MKKRLPSDQLDVLFQDEHIVVVNKPPGLTTVRHLHETKKFGARAKRFLPPTLLDKLSQQLGNGGRRAPLFAVHRLDRDTSGVIVFARTKQTERTLGKQLRANKFQRKYRAVTRGVPTEGSIESWLMRDRGDGRRGSTFNKSEGKHAVTHVQIVENLGEFALVECQLETGRTHQIRIHLGERQTPLCGETIYDRPLHGKPLPDDSGAERPLLHAAFLELEHPIRKKRLSWSARIPDDMRKILRMLRRRTKNHLGK